MKIAIDLQGAQTESRFRGVGRYSLSLALAIAQNAGKHEIWLVLNSAFPDAAEKIRDEFSGLVPAERIRAFDVPFPLAEYNPVNGRCTRAAEMIRECFIESLKPDIVLITSLFEGFCDDAVTSVGAFTGNVRTAVVLYDLIPLINPGTYLDIAVKRQHYERKMKWLKNADLLLAISEYSKMEAIDALGINPDRVINISAAVDGHFLPKQSLYRSSADILNGHNISRPFILYVPGGSDGRKNFDRLIVAFSMLPEALIQTHQLVIASRLEDLTCNRLLKIARASGLSDDSLILTGYVSDKDLSILYAQAKLCVFPSTHEGFGLPVLEAMACGVPVIGSATTSIPEVIGLQEALFDPLDPASIAEKMQEVLENPPFLNMLREHGIEQSKKFSWNGSAVRALNVMEEFFSDNPDRGSEITTSLTRKPRMAYFSPLPPARTGIADFSAEIILPLSRHYTIDLITSDAAGNHQQDLKSLEQHSVKWFCENAHKFDRILYHMGNSPFHSYMLPLLRDYPGTIVLHDFFLGHLMAYEECAGPNSHMWTDALYQSHGYKALLDKFHTYAKDPGHIKDKYPCNLDVIECARGVIVHSEYSRQIGMQWYGQKSVSDWHVIPLARRALRQTDCRRDLCSNSAEGPSWDDQKKIARHDLKIREDIFVVCSFGLLDPSKSNDALIDAWLASTLVDDASAMLIFVGENHGGEYGRHLLKKINENSSIQSMIQIKGRVNSTVYKNYLLAADVAVQLRSVSRGETSAAVLDCMGSGLPVIVNAGGSMGEISPEDVYMLPACFTRENITEALDSLRECVPERNKMGLNALNTVRTKHNPLTCSDQYFSAIESSYRNSGGSVLTLCRSVASVQGLADNQQDLLRVSRAIAATFRPKAGKKQLLVDVSSVSRNDLKAGIERVVRAQLRELILSPPEGFRVEPVYLKAEKQNNFYQYAREFTCRLLGLAPGTVHDTPVDTGHGDIFYAMDFCPGEYVKAAKLGIYSKWRLLGVHINVQIYDLLPVIHPEFFPPGADASHSEWLQMVCSTADSITAISASVAEEVREWIRTNKPEQKNLKVYPIPLGADIEASSPTSGLPGDASDLLISLEKKICFTMVGTIEPRKGYLQAINAFELLWRNGQEDICLVIVGREGWKHLPDISRRTIPETVRKIKSHPQYGKNIFWVENASDEFLQKIYEKSNCLISASEGEGFGLPLAEAARAGLPIIARDIPVFREVAGENILYFSGSDGASLAASIQQWLNLFRTGQLPESTGIVWRTWKDVCRDLASIFSREGMQPGSSCLIDMNKMSKICAG